jgi:poly-gamma-glutamate capsule biosynthesis protein CapA/YwtB (metallophosphatase superfamily)
MIGGLVLAVVLAAPCQRPAPTDTLRLVAVGDINLGRRLARAQLLQGDTLYPFRAVRAWLAADITFGNLESPIAPDSAPSADTGSLFAAPRLAALALARAGFDIVSTANNHAWDAGPAGVTETMRQLTRAGVRFVGSGFGRDMAEQPVILERRGWRVAVFAVTRAWNPAPYSFYQHAGANWIAWGQPAWIYPAIGALQASGRADLIIVSVHGGHEYVDAPPDYYRDFLYGLIDAGADLVLAHHPHVLQPVVWHRGKPIVQSLGNFVFVQNDPWTRLSAILQVVVAPGRTMRLSAIPVRVGAQPQLATGAAADSVRRRFHLPLSTPTAPKP